MGFIYIDIRNRNYRTRQKAWCDFLISEVVEGGEITDRTKSDFYIIEYENEPVGGIRVRNHNGGNIMEGVRWISPIFVIPSFQGKGIAQKVIDKVFNMYPDTLTWRLDTIKQEPGNCHLYEKCGFVRYGDEDVINGKMTLVKYEKSCVRVRRITDKKKRRQQYD